MKSLTLLEIARALVEDGKITEEFYKRIMNDWEYYNGASVSDLALARDLTLRTVGTIISDRVFFATGYLEYILKKRR